MFASRGKLTVPAWNFIRGVTLVELVVTILIMGILAGGTTAYITSSTQSYVDTATRNQLSGIARLTTMRLERELGNAVPNSVRTRSGTGEECIEFFPIEDVTRYLSLNLGGTAESMTVVPFAKGAALTSRVAAAQAAGESLPLFPIIYPTFSESLYADNTLATQGPRATTSAYSSSVTSGVETLSFSSHQFDVGTVRQRLYLAGEPVSFCVVGDKMFRYKNYGVSATQCLPSTADCLPTSRPDRSVVSDQIDNASIAETFEYADGDIQSYGLVRVNLNFADGSETLVIHHEIQINNAP